MVKVCNAIMGSGKTQAAISYINAHPERKFLYITPYMEEATRIRLACPQANFVEPDQLPQYNLSKSTHTNALVASGRSVASTHQAMMYYTSDTIRMLKEQNYTLIIDEEVNVLQASEGVSSADIKLAMDGGYIEAGPSGEYRYTGKEYGGGKLGHLFRMLKSRPLINIKGARGSWYWLFTKELLSEVDDVIVLTYLFEGSAMQSFMKMFDVPYTYIGIHKAGDNIYTFADRPEYVPEYVQRLPEMIHIEMDPKINSIGEGSTALSENWYKKNGNVDEVRKNIYNYFRNRLTWLPASERLCARFSDNWGQIRDKGYWDRGLIFCQKATNKYSKCHALAYPVNVIVNPRVANYYAQNGAPIDRDVYSLSIMLQWIWRSAIRNGEEIWLYVPSKRMRELLIAWIQEASRGGIYNQTGGG